VGIRHFRPAAWRLFLDHHRFSSAATAKSSWAATARFPWQYRDERQREKVRRLYHGQVIAGFAGATADAFTLFERFEGQLETSGPLVRAAVELAKEWRTDRS
jgi:uncharacterized membrane protein